MSRRSCLAALAAAIALAVSTRPAGADVVVEGTLKANLLMFGKTDGRVTVRTRGDRQATEITGVTSSLFDTATTPLRGRTIVRLDRRLVWTVNPADTSHTEVTFADASVARRVLAAPAPESLTIVPRTERDTIAGHPARRVDARWLMSPAPGAPALRMDAEIWVARGSAAVESLLAFERRASAAGGPGALFETAGLPRAGAAHVPTFERLGGYPLRVLVRMVVPGFGGGGSLPPADSARAAAEDLDPRTGAMTVARFEVSALRGEPVAAEAYELPPGSKRRTSAEESLLEMARPASPAKR
jgi:hypothetical protein